MTPYRQPPWTKIYLGHAIGTAVLGALLPAGEHLKGLHAFALPVLQWFPGAISLSKQAPDPVFARVFLALSMLIAAFMLIGAIFHASRARYVQKTFENRREWWKAYLLVLSFAILGVAIFWNAPYTPDGAETRAYALTVVAISNKLGVLTVMNQLIVGAPLYLLLMPLTMPFCTVIKNNAV